LEIEKELAKRRHENQRDSTGRYQPLETNVSNGIGKTTEIVAKTIGVNYKTFERAKKIIEKAPENIIQRKTTIFKRLS